MRTVTRRAAAAAAIALLAAGTTACGGGSGGSGGSGASGEAGALTVWTLENLPDRLAATRTIVDDFTADTGIEVELVGIDENQFNQLITTAAAAGDLPDVIGALSLAGVRTLSANELVDTAAAGAVVDALGADTFFPRALELTRQGDAQLSVPSDGWAQLLVYRKDLFEQAGLAVPQTYETIRAAAEALDSEQIAGFVGATVPNDAFTQQTFEHLALGNGCELVDDAGEVTLDSSQCVNAFSFYGDLVTDFSVPGAQDVDTTRATYFAGQAAMVVWSSFILDEMAGLREDAKPSCPQCQADPAFLAKNSGIVTGIAGPDGGEPTQFGELVSWAITAESATEPAQRFVQHMMSDGYEDWIGFAPEGKFPARQGTADAATRYVDAWQTLPAGVTTKAALSDFYSPEVLEALRTSPDSFSRWGITQGQGNLVGAILGELPVPQAVSALAGGEVEAAEAAKQAAESVRSIQESLE
jgi:multiple sugar transport system substrate-binding protein